jgi:hypothetical protein
MTKKYPAQSLIDLETMQALEASRLENRRSMSAEIAYRLEQSLRADAVTDRQQGVAAGRNRRSMNAEILARLERDLAREGAVSEGKAA